MRSDEFPDYVAYFVPDYAMEISSNYDMNIETARARAEREVEEVLGKGVDTPDQVLLCAVAEGGEDNTPVGYFWCQPNKTSQSMFISDFCILPPHRGRGYGKSALVALEEKFAEMGYSEIRLRVAADNKRAERLYLLAGFIPTGTNMRKTIGNS